MTTTAMIGLVASAVGMGATVVSNWVDERKMDEKIEKKVNEALAEREKENNEEEE